MNLNTEELVALLIIILPVCIMVVVFAFVIFMVVTITFIRGVVETVCSINNKPIKTHD